MSNNMTKAALNRRAVDTILIIEKWTDRVASEMHKHGHAQSFQKSPGKTVTFDVDFVWHMVSELVSQAEQLKKFASRV